MAASMPASQRRRVVNGDHRPNAHRTADDNDLFGVPRSPSPKLRSPQAGAGRKKLSKHVDVTSNRSQAQVLSLKKSLSSRTKMDVFDLPDSDNDLPPQTRPVPSSAKILKQKSTKKYTRIISPGSDTEPAIPTAGKSKSFDFPGSSDDERQKPRVTYSSKVEFRKSHRSAKPQQSSLRSERSADKTLNPSWPSTSSGSNHKVLDTRVRSPRDTLMTSEPVNLSLPVRHVTKSIKTTKTDSSRPLKKIYVSEERRVPAKSNYSTSKAIPQKMIGARETTRRDIAVSIQRQKLTETTSVDVESVISKRSSSPEQAKHDKVQTPKRKVLWGKLLDSLDGTHSPSDLPISDMRLSTAKKRSSTIDGDLLMSNEGVPKKKAKLVSALKHSSHDLPEEVNHAPSQSSVTSESDDSGDEAPVVENESQSSQKRANSMAIKVTYSQQRSYLAEQTEETMLDAMLEEMSQPVTRSLEVSQKDNFDLDSDDQSDDAGQPKSAHDLRAAGTKKRMLEDLENLIGGLENENVGASSKRADLVEITNSMLSSGTVELILDHGLDRQLVSAFVKSQDAVFLYIGMCCLSLLVLSTKQLAVLRGFIRAGVLDKLFQSLRNDQNIDMLVKERKANLSGIAQRKVITLSNAIRASKLWEIQSPAKMSPRLAALRLLELIITLMVDLGANDVVVDEEQLLLVLDLLADQDRVDDFSSYSWLVFSVLKATSSGTYVSKRGPWTTKTLNAAASHLPRAIEGIEGDDSDASWTVCSFIMNITNNNEKACEIIAKQSITLPMTEAILQGFDSIVVDGSEALILKLGAMINLAELSDSARLRIVSEALAPLRLLVDRFCRQLEAASQESTQLATQQNIPYGYLALWLVNLCQNDDVRAVILQSLPKIDQRDGLIQAAETFIAAHQQTDMESSTNQSQDERRAASNNGLAETIKKMKAASSTY